MRLPAQARTGAVRERDELREALNARAQILEESHTDLRDRLRAAGDAPGRPRRCRPAQQPGDETGQ